MKTNMYKKKRKTFNEQMDSLPTYRMRRSKGIALYMQLFTKSFRKEFSGMGVFSLRFMATFSFALVALFGTFGSYAYASPRITKGDTLYPVKKAIEQVRIDNASSEQEKAEVYTDITKRRAQEVEWLRKEDAENDAVDYTEELKETLVELDEVEAYVIELEELLETDFFDEELEAELEEYELYEEELFGVIDELEENGVDVDEVIDEYYEEVELEDVEESDDSDWDWEYEQEDDYDEYDNDEEEEIEEVELDEEEWEEYEDELEEEIEYWDVDHDNEFEEEYEEEEEIEDEWEEEFEESDEEDEDLEEEIELED